MPDQTLLTAFEEIRTKTLKLIQLPPQFAIWRPEGSDNHILWHAGHIYAMVERLAVTALQEVVDADIQIPKGWWRLFGWGSEPERYGPDDWPALEDVHDQLRRQFKRITNMITQVSDEQLSQPLQNAQSGWNGRPIRRVVLHAFHDEACHTGEIWLLRKLLVHELEKNEPNRSGPTRG